METSVKESLGHETSNLGPRLEDGPRLLMSMPRLNLAPATKSASGIDSKSICMSDELCDAIVRTWKLFEKSISGVFSVEMADVLTMISLRFEAPIRSVITTKTLSIEMESREHVSTFNIGFALHVGMPVECTNPILDVARDDLRCHLDSKSIRWPRVGNWDCHIGGFTSHC